MKKPAKDDRQFLTHIAEPRWQQVVSVILVLAVISVWIWLASRH